MDTLKRLENLGASEQDVRKGDPIEIDVVTLQAAKKSKWSEVTNAQDSTDVIEAYAKDLASTLDATDKLQQQNMELVDNIEQLTTERDDLQAGTKVAGVLDGRMDDFQTVLDNMEAELRECTVAKQTLEKERDTFKQQVEEVQVKNDTLQQQVTELQAERDTLFETNQRLQTQFNESQTQLGALQTQLDEAQQSLDDVTKDLQKYDSYVDDLENRISSVVHALQNELIARGIQFASVNQAVDATHDVPKE